MFVCFFFFFLLNSLWTNKDVVFRISACRLVAVDVGRRGAQRARGRTTEAGGRKTRPSQNIKTRSSTLIFHWDYYVIAYFGNDDFFKSFAIWSFPRSSRDFIMKDFFIKFIMFPLFYVKQISFLKTFTFSFFYFFFLLVSLLGSRGEFVYVLKYF